MYINFRFNPIWMGALLVFLGVWFVAREVFHVGPWFGPVSLAVMALASAVGHFVTRRAFGWLMLVYVFGSWAAFASLDVLLAYRLPGSFLPAFWGLGLMAYYALHTRPNRWPLIPATILLGVATVLYVISVGVRTAPYWIPVLLIIWGLSTLFRRRGGGGGGGGGETGGDDHRYIE